MNFPDDLTYKSSARVPKHLGHQTDYHELGMLVNLLLIFE